MKVNLTETARHVVTTLLCKECSGQGDRPVDPDDFMDGPWAVCPRCHDHPGIDPDVIRTSAVTHDSGHAWLSFDDLGWLADDETVDAHYHKPYVVVVL